MTLKGVCNTLSRRPKALDVVMLFTQSVTLLQPLCHILDNWQEHEDQGLSLSRNFAFYILANAFQVSIIRYMMSSGVFCSLLFWSSIVSICNLMILE